MSKSTQLDFFKTPQPAGDVGDWTFNGASTRELTHCYHDYPARMIPQVAAKLLDLFGGNAKKLFDPYCGSGTSLVEANIRGIDAYGTDLNPLARLISKSKTTLPKITQIEKQISFLNKMILDGDLPTPQKAESIYGISNLNFWFKPNIIDRLFQLKVFIQNIKEKDVRLFFQIAFSETVRESSNTRNGEFKLYRYHENELIKFNPNVYEIMLSKLHRNLAGFKKYKSIIENLKEVPITKVYDFNTVNGIPINHIPPKSIDIVVTSPPYGDSHTTVAYGQYSRLSAAWLDLEEPGKIDQKLMGGKTINDHPLLPSEALMAAIENISKSDEKRSKEVLSFYSDLYSSIQNVANIVKHKGHICYVVGNRKVKGVVLPTDIAIRNFFEGFGFEYINTFIRSIPNKRMPSKNSPTNAPGVLDNTMTKEYIVVMRRF